MSTLAGAFIRRSSGALMVRGVLAILLAIITFSAPHISLALILALFGAYAFIDGIVALIGGFRATHAGKRYWPSILEGVLGILVGIAAFARPTAVAFGLLIVIAARSIIIGVLEVAAAFELRDQIEHEWLLGLSGIASIAFGALLLSRPAPGVIALVWLVGVYALIYGVSLVVLGARVRGITREPLVQA
jgi:uncharacterized membrane protein HdeD (DUF308 family)